MFCWPPLWPENKRCFYFPAIARGAGWSPKGSKVAKERPFAEDVARKKAMRFEKAVEVCIYDAGAVLENDRNSKVF
jgi:hypothetical protein